MLAISEIIIGICAIGAFWNLLLFMSAISMMEFFPDEKKEARVSGIRLLICVAVIIVGSVINR